MEGTEGTTTESATVRLAGQSFAIAPLRLGRMKGLRAQLKLVIGGGGLEKGELPDAELLDAYTALVSASVRAANPTITVEAFQEMIDGLEYFDGAASLAVASAAVLKLSFGDVVPGEASGPASSVDAISTSTGSTD